MARVCPDCGFSFKDESVRCFSKYRFKGFHSCFYFCPQCHNSVEGIQPGEYEKNGKK